MKNPIFQAENVQWFYERSYGLGYSIIALLDGDRKVGQLAMVYQRLLIDDQSQIVPQIVDQFVLKEFSGRQSMQALATGLEAELVAKGFRFALGMPNIKLMGANEYFFKLMSTERLPLSAGVAIPRPWADGKAVSFRYSSNDPDARRRLESLLPASPIPNHYTGLAWDGETLANRISSKKHDYGISFTDDLLLVSSPRVKHGLPHTLLCGFFSRTGKTSGRASIRRIVRAACKLWQRPIFIFAGVNKDLACAPGIRVPKRFVRSPLTIQVRDCYSELPSLRFNRFQLLDFDFA